MRVCCALACGVGVLAASVALAQEPSPACAAIVEYADCNRGDPPELAIRIVTGRVLIEPGVQAGDARPAGGTCAALFTPDGRVLVSSAALDGEGRFRFGTVVPGPYRLVVRGPGSAFHVANRRIRVYSRGRGPVPKTVGLLVRLLPVGTQGCSAISRE